MPLSPDRTDSTPCPEIPRQRPWWIATVWLGLATGLIGLPPSQVLAQAPETKKEAENAPKELEPFCILPESYEMRPKIFVLARNAQRVGYTLMRETSLGLEPYTRSELRNLRLSWRQCMRYGKEAATRHLKTLEHSLHRDERGVIAYAHIQSENPLTASIFLSPEFPERFAKTLGKDLYVAIPDRFNVFVFPKLENSIKPKYASKMAIFYKEGLYPVSREVFELSKDGIRVAGKF